MPNRRTMIRTSIGALAATTLGAAFARADDATTAETASGKIRGNGDPGNKSIPAGPAYTADKRATIVFNDTCQVAGDPDGEVRPLWSKIATS